MELKVKVFRIGGSVAVVIPKRIVEELGVMVGDEFRVDIKGRSIVYRGR